MLDCKIGVEQIWSNHEERPLRQGSLIYGEIETIHLKFTHIRPVSYNYEGRS